MMRILLIGKNGQVGREVLPLLTSFGQVMAVGHGECDLAVPAAIQETVRSYRPSIIINAAAYTNVNAAESNRSSAVAINGTAPGILASLARETDAVLLHYSSDYVFDGTKPGPWSESDATGPLNVYGESKLMGEEAVIAAGCRYLILRTSWIYGLHGTNFLRTICKLACERKELHVVNDQIGSPTSSRQIARATAGIISLVREKPETVSPGIYHLTSSGAVSWFGFAEAIVAAMSRSQVSSLAQVLPISSAQFPSPAKRPFNSVLDNSKFYRVFGFGLDSWRQELGAVLAK